MFGAGCRAGVLLRRREQWVEVDGTELAGAGALRFIVWHEGLHLGQVTLLRSHHGLTRW
jgi:hypothetical protein